ncbi:cytochrome C biogenesis protein [Halobacteria archaeon AArc-dxtr1]|nr:cytochrome C biogenesis protein [Halobacteria archaeon AArc-dxtr1]
MFDAALAPTLGFALLAGLATFFSPCAYPLLPGYVGFYVSQTESRDPSLGGALARGLVAGAGVLTVFVALFGVAFTVGQETLAHVTVLEPIVGIVLIVFGVLVVVGRAPSLSVALPKRRSGVLGFWIFGAGYALAAAGCVFAVVLAVVSLAVSLPAVSGLVVLGTYIGTVTVLMVSVTVATGMGLVAGGGRLAAHSGTIERLAGAVMIVAGVGQLYLALFVTTAA